MVRWSPRSPSAAVMLGAMALDELFGDPSDTWHPVRWFGLAITRLERVLYRDSKSRGATFFTLALGSVSLAPTLFAPGGRVAECVALWLTLGGRSLVREAEAIAALLERDDLPGARRRLCSLVGRDTDALDAGEVARAVIESIAENTTDAVLGPLVWYAIAGLGGSLAFRSINTLDAMVGHQNSRYRNFGFVSAKADDLVVAPAAVIGCAVTWMFAGQSGRRRALTCLTSAPAHPSLNAGLIEAAFAGSLGVELGGINRYRGRPVSTPRLPGGDPPDVHALRRAARLSRVVGWSATLILAVGVATLA
ncbi:MAG: cobalamin biosynthesis protein CobD/CbiB [Ferrimicrobium sp.]|uniref:Cobalamin biosynthesis protein CobD n=1 Tax=Ferrimicrobium acidiphilum TaxID=121039 RepID=A0ABV3Y5X6_9ACTN